MLLFPFLVHSVIHFTKEASSTAMINRYRPPPKPTKTTSNSVTFEVPLVFEIDADRIEAAIKCARKFSDSVDSVTVDNTAPNRRMAHITVNYHESTNNFDDMESFIYWKMINQIDEQIWKYFKLKGHKNTTSHHTKSSKITEFEVD